jgi:hypothetical protein
MKNILFIHPGQFGTQTSTYNYCLHLKDKYNVFYIGFDYGFKNREIDGVNYIHLPQEGNGLANRILLYKTIFHELRKNKYDFVLINYFIFCSLIRFFSRDRMIVEIRSGFIFSSLLKRILYNTIMFFEVRMFKRITTISSGIIKYLNLPKRTHVLPLGGISMPSYKKCFDSLNILYVGTFHERNIVNTIYAYSKFHNEFKDQIQSKYTIIGFGSEEEINKIVTLIDELKMSSQILCKGVIRFPELSEYLESHNVGMSYIPIREHFQDQPPSKTFEYLLSGMAVLATSTRENIKVINESNGVTINDSIDDIYHGLKEIYSKRLSYDSLYIQEKAQKHSWDSIVNRNLIPYLEKIIFGNKS